MAKELTRLTVDMDTGLRQKLTIAQGVRGFSCATDYVRHLVDQDFNACLQAGFQTTCSPNFAEENL